MCFILPVSGQDNPIRYDKPRFILDPDDRNMVDLAYSPDGAILAAAGDNKVSLWNTVTGEAVMQFEVDQRLTRIAFLPDDDLLAIYGENNVRIWNLTSGDVRSDFTVGQKQVAVAVSPDGDLLAFAEGTGVSLVNLADAEAGDIQEHAFVANDSARNWDAVAFDPSGQYLAAGYIVYGGPETDFAVSMWDVHTDKLVRKFASLTSAVTDLEFNISGTLLASTGTVSTVWNVRTGNTLYTTTLYSRNALPEAGISFNGDYLILSDVAPAIGRYETTTLRDAESGDLLALFHQDLPSGGGGGDGAFYHPVAFHPEGTQFATVDRGGQVVVWDMPTDVATADTSINIIAYCDDLPGKPKQPSAADEVNIIWSWYATEIPLIYDHMGWSSYAIILDGKSLSADSALRSAIRRDPTNDNHWTLYYSLNVGKLTPGTHTIAYSLTWGKAISDGLDQFGPGTSNPDNTGTCTFEVDG
jgi:WD40 repeat protein